MKINYLFRSTKNNEYSIENVFEQIISNLNKKILVEKIYVPQPSNSIINIINNIRSVKYKRGEIYHITGDVHYLALVLKKDKFILTIHDLVTLKNKKGIKRFILKFFWYTIPIKKSKFVVAISESTKEEILNEFPNLGSKLKVIPNPINSMYSFKSSIFNKDFPRILHIGTRENKNLERVIKAVEDLNCKLVIIGKLNEEQKKLLTSTSLNYENYYNISDEELKNQYYNCDIVMFPSLYEGFGLPIIEGQMVGRVVITSNYAPMNIVAGSGACLVNPRDYIQIREAIEKVCNNSEYREKLIANGRENVKKFSGKYIAEQYEKLYNELRN